MQKISKKSVISIVLASIFTAATILTCCLLFIPSSPVSVLPDNDSTTVSSGLNYSYGDAKTESITVTGSSGAPYTLNVIYSTKYIDSAMACWYYYSSSRIYYGFNINVKQGLTFSTSNSLTCKYTYGTYYSDGFSGYTYSYAFSYDSDYNMYYNASARALYQTATIQLPQISPTTTLYFEENGGSSVSNKTVTCGSRISTLSTPTRSGYTFLGWFVDGNQISADTYYMWDEPKVAFAQWERNTVASSNYTLSSSVNNASYGKIIGAGSSYPENTTVTLSAVPTANYEFSYWTIDSSYISTANPLQFSMVANTTVQAVFEPNSLSSFTVNFSGGGGTYTVKQTDNDYAMITLMPDAGQYIDSISFDNGLSTKIEYYNGAIVNCGSNVLYATYLTNNNDNKNMLTLSLYKILGNCTINVLTTTNAPTLEENTGGGVNIDGIALKSTTGGEARVVGSGEGTTLVAINYSGYAFLYWEGSKSGEISSDMSYTINEEDYTGEIITAVFAPINSSDINFDTDSNSDDF